MAASVSRTPSELDSLFHTNISAVLSQIVTSYPENAKAKEINAMLPLVAMQPALKTKFRSEFRTFTLNSIPQILERDTTYVFQLFDSSEYDMLKSMGIHNILADPKGDSASQDSLWQYLQLLTQLAHAGTETEIKIKPANTAAAAQVHIAPPVAFAAQPQQGQQQPKAAAPPNMEAAMKTLLDSMPKMVSTFNTLMQDPDGSNVFAQMAKTFTNPDQLQTGVANNLAANLMGEQGSGPSMMQQIQDSMGTAGSDLNADDIVSKLAKLERIEKLHKRKKEAASKSGR